MILIGLGSNLEGRWGSPRETVEEALAALDREGVRLIAASALIETLPLGPPDQPHYVNAVARVETRLEPDALMRRLHAIEQEAGRERRRRWGPRTLDLDLLDYDGRIQDGPPILPHPGIAERDFVLAPIMEIAPRWRHPVLHKTARTLRQSLTGTAGRMIATTVTPH